MFFDKNTKTNNPGGGFVKLPRTTKVKNKQPAPIQITAEQILREAFERQEADPKPPRQKITDPDELEEYRVRKRKGFEDAVRRARTNSSTWVKYAQWEETQREFDRARSIFERAIDVDYRNINVWLKYAEMEMKHKFVNHARNIWDRAVILLPRVDQFWYKYTFMEETLGNFAGARQIFERWMEWKPDPHAWSAYIKFELRHGEEERARSIYERFVMVHPTVKAWIKYAKFEEDLGQIEKAREIFERAMDLLGEEGNDEKLFIAFARFEERYKEYERARVIYKYALDHIPRERAQELYKMFISFEKQFGDRAGIEEVIVGKRRFQYEEEVRDNPRNYDAWFDYIRLEEANGEVEKVREVYERAISNLPPAPEKRLWRRYIFLWINYAVFEELEANDIERAREVYKECLKYIPHKKFSFSKIWIMFAKFEIRQKNLEAARAVLGNAIGMAPKDKIFKTYIDLEHQLGNIDRCRKLYEKYIEWSPANCSAWVDYCKLESSLQEVERARALFEFAISQPLLDMPELLWKSYIDFELEQGEIDRVRKLYRRLLERTKHVKVWISFAQMEKAQENKEAARSVYQEASDELRKAIQNHLSDPPTDGLLELKEERVALIQSWCAFEKEMGSEADLARTQKLVPKRIRKQRKVQEEGDEEERYVEYYDYIFPDDESNVTNLSKFAERAYKWKMEKQNMLMQVEKEQQKQRQPATFAAATADEDEDMMGK